MRALAPILAGLMAVALPAAAQDAASAKAFLTALYASYHGDGPDIFGKQAAKVFSPRLRDLIRRDRELAHGEVGALDGDPVCNCQDFDIKAVRVDATLTGPGRAQATANFRNFGKPQVVRLDLVSVAGGWRIDNIHEDGTPDLALYLTKHAGGR
jgi:hypothetical protein